MKLSSTAMALGITASVIAGCSREAAKPVMPATTDNQEAAAESNAADDSQASRDRRVQALLDEMTTDQKIALISGTGGDWGEPSQARSKVPGAAGFTVAIESLGISTIALTDGPAGVRIWPKRPGSEKTYYATAFPVETVISSSWDLEIARAVGSAMGHETREYGADILLAPGMNIHRDPRGGRNFHGAGDVHQHLDGDTVPLETAFLALHLGSGQCREQ